MNWLIVTDLDGTLSRLDEYIDLVTYVADDPGVPKVTWRITLDPDEPGGEETLDLTATTAPATSCSTAKPWRTRGSNTTTQRPR